MEKILKKLRVASVGYSLVPSEYNKDNDYIDGMMIQAEDMRGLIGDTDIDVILYVGLQEYEVDGTWNELRIGKMVVDIDAPNELTLKEWVKYLGGHLKEKEVEVDFMKVLDEFEKSIREEIKEDDVDIEDEEEWNSVFYYGIIRAVEMIRSEVTNKK